MHGSYYENTHTCRNAVYESSLITVELVIFHRRQWQRVSEVSIDHPLQNLRKPENSIILPLVHAVHAQHF